MRRFVFRLQRALRFALLRENQKKAQIASALQRIQFLQQYLDRLDSQIRQAVSKSSLFHTLEGEAHRNAVPQSIEEHKRLTGVLSEERGALETRRTELARLSQRRRSLESLKEKRRADFRVEQSRAEQKQIDDIVSGRRGQDLLEET